MKIDHTGKRILITGGASGIGHAIAKAFADLGAQVYVTDVSREAVKAARNDGMHASVADASRESDVVELVGAVNKTMGGLDILINNAGIPGPTANIEDILTDDFEQTMRVSLFGTWMHSKHFMPNLRQSAEHGNEPSIITMASIAGIRGAPQRTPYVSAKWAIVGLTKALARELGADGIRVNAIAPGIIEGPRIDGVIERKAAAIGRPIADVRAEYVGQADLGRMPEGQDIANMCAFVTSSLGRNIHGQVLSVDGHIDRII